MVAFISSNIPDAGELLITDILIKTSDSFFTQTGLKCDSVIRIHKITTVPQKIVQRTLGTIPNTLEMVISEKIKTLFELP